MAKKEHREKIANPFEKILWPNCLEREVDFNRGGYSGFEKARKIYETKMEEAKKQLIAHIEKNCKGYEDRTVGTLMDSAFWRTLKSTELMFC